MEVRKTCINNYLQSRLRPIDFQIWNNPVKDIIYKQKLLVQHPYEKTLRIPVGGIHAFSSLDSTQDPLMAVGTIDQFYTLKLLKPHRKLTEEELRARSSLEEVVEPQYGIGDYFTIYEKSKYHKNIFTDLLFHTENNVPLALFTASEDRCCTKFDLRELKEINGALLEDIPMRILYHRHTHSLITLTNSGLHKWDDRTINEASHFIEGSDISNFSLNTSSLIISRNNTLEFRDFRNISTPMLKLTVNPTCNITSIHMKHKELLFSTCNGITYYIPNINTLNFPNSRSSKNLQKLENSGVRLLYDANFQKSRRSYCPALSFCGIGGSAVLVNDPRNKRLVLVSKHNSEILRILPQTASVCSTVARVSGIGERPDYFAISTLSETFILKNSKVRSPEKITAQKRSSEEFLGRTGRTTSDTVLDLDFGGNFGTDEYQPEWSQTIISDKKFECSYRHGYHDCQVSVCLTCLRNQRRQGNQNSSQNENVDISGVSEREEILFGFCRQCEEYCHRRQGHVTARIGKKSMFRCDCGILGRCHCVLKKTSVVGHISEVNSENKYNDNFKNLFCYCKRDGAIDDFQYQCIGCEDWFHEKCIFQNSETPENERRPVEDIAGIEILNLLREDELGEYHYLCKNCFSLDETERESENSRVMNNMIFQSCNRGLFCNGSLAEVKGVFFSQRILGGSSGNVEDDAFSKMCDEIISSHTPTPIATPSTSQTSQAPDFGFSAGNEQMEDEVIVFGGALDDPSGVDEEEDIIGSDDENEEVEGEGQQDDVEPMEDDWIV